MIAKESCETRAVAISNAVTTAHARHIQACKEDWRLLVMRDCSVKWKWPLIASCTEEWQAKVLEEASQKWQAELVVEVGYI